MGAGWVTGGPQATQALRGVGRAWQACGLLVAPLWHFFRPVFFIKSQKIPRWFLGHLELRRIEDSDLLLFQSRIPPAGILPLQINLAKLERKGISMVPQSIIIVHKAININMKAWCKMDVSTPPSLDLACPQAKTKTQNMSTCLGMKVSIKHNTDMRASWSHMEHQYIIEILMGK